MKRIVVLTLLSILFICTKNAAQDKSTQAFFLNKLNIKDTLLSGWKFKVGDNAPWAQPDFDDRDWQAVDPGADLLEFKALRNSGVVWLRLHVKVDSSVAGQPLIAWVNQYTASEIYVNGTLVKKYGSIDRNANKTVAKSPFENLFSIPLKPGSDQIIAVRLGYQRGIPYISPNFVPLPAFCMYVNNYKSALVNQHAAQENVKSFQIGCAVYCGLFVIVAVLSLLYFLFDRKQQVQLYYFLYTSSLFIINWISLQYFSNMEDVSSQMWGNVLLGTAFITEGLFLVMTVYSLFNYHRRSIFKVLCLVGVSTLLCLSVSEIIAYMICNIIFPLICMLECVRVCIIAIKMQKTDAALILTGLTLCICFTVVAALLDQSSSISLLLGSFANLSVPMGMLFYLAYQNSVTRKQMAFNLSEIQILSADNLAREQEKQLILANQNQLLDTQVNQRTAELNLSLSNLKSTQTQLIQAEKMASLGELTAGIAHEIQNPLSFVNNFSEVSVELLDELEDELNKGDTVEAIAITGDVKQNLQKILHHGKRADFIVKGMLQHSRTSSGERQLTNINVLADEFLKLSYHGLRAKDKNFNAELITHFDENPPKVNVVQQDIGRVLLNLFNNAFYAVNEKKKTVGDDYKPAVSITTSCQNNQVIISVKDNGVGISDAIKDKIMQPFFTTKPTGEGTGLGLSLSYDIVVKGHGGKIDIDSRKNQGSEFIVILPINL